MSGQEAPRQLAQQGERLVYTQEAGGSKPSLPTGLGQQGCGNGISAPIEGVTVALVKVTERRGSVLQKHLT